MIPQLSIQERDRRYKLVRAEMAQRGIDVLLLPANTGRWEQLQGDSRYLTSIGGFATEMFTVFPARRRSYFLRFQPRQLVAESAELGRRRARRAQPLESERHRAHQGTETRKRNHRDFRPRRSGARARGDHSYTSVKAIQEAFPQAKIVNATEMMQEIRAIKSAEEVAFLERSARSSRKPSKR